MKKVLKIVLVVLLIAGGTFGGYYYETLQKEKIRADLEGRIESTERKKDLIHQKYKEKSALATQLIRNKSILEGQKRAAQEETKKLQEEIQRLSGGKEALIGKIKKHEGQIKALKGKIDKLKKEVQSAKAEYQKEKAEYTKTLNERERQVAKKNSEIKNLEMKLRRTLQDFDRCVGKNARLCIIAQELIAKYKNKGVVKSFLTAEPFTQIKKVELEKMIQEYEDRIDKEKQRKK